MKALTYTQKSHTYRTLTYTQASMKYSVRCIVQTTLHCDQTLNGGIRCSPQQHLSLSLSLISPFKQSSSVSPLQFFTLVFYALCMQLSCSLFPSSLYILSSPWSSSHFSPSFFLSLSFPRVWQQETITLTDGISLLQFLSVCLPSSLSLSHSSPSLCIHCPIPSHSFCSIPASLSHCLFLSGCNWYL